MTREEMWLQEVMGLARSRIGNVNEEEYVKAFLNLAKSASKEAQDAEEDWENGE